MRSTPVGIVMLNDERPHVTKQNNAENQRIVAAWTKTLEKLLVNTDGSAVKIIPAKRIVDSVRSAQKVGEQLRRSGVRSLVMLYNVWNFPFLAWPLVHSLAADTPILSLSNNNGKYPGNVGLLATDGALRQAGRRTHRIVGDVKDKATVAKVVAWIRAAQAVTTIRNEVYGLYGGHSMGMETGFFHLTATLKALGATCRQVDQLWLVEQMKTVKNADVTAGREWFESMLKRRVKYDGKMLTPETLETQIRLYLAMEAVNKDKGFDFCGLKGQRELTEYVCLGDVSEMLMNDPYDWRGPKESMVCATEADAYAAVTMQLLKYLSGGLPTLFMDVRLYHPDRDLWDLCNSGNHASWYAARSNDPKRNFRKITLHPALEFYFKAGGASVEFDAAPGPLTFARLGLWDEKPFMTIIPGEAVKLPAEERAAINAETNPTWPHVHAKLACPFEEFLTVFPCNHILAVDGDRVATLEYLCEIANIPAIVLGRGEVDPKTPLWQRLR